MTAGGARAAGLAAAAIAAATLVGCVDPIVNRPRGEVEHWTGEAAAIEAADGGCGAVQLALFRDALAIGGTAIEPNAPREGVLPAVQRWWVEGTVNPNGTFLFSLRQQGPLLGEGPRPASIWRGRFSPGEVVAIEQPPACGRRVRLVRQEEAAGAS
jgi:hypothetical protein